MKVREVQAIPEGGMPSYRKARSLASRFDQAYPEKLPDRLDWLQHFLGINRVRLLRMMGMSAAEATKEKDTGWADLIKKGNWEDNAWWVEGKLYELLALFDYDWKALSDRLHQESEIPPKEPTRLKRHKGDIVKLQYVPSDDGTRILLNQLAKTGPESFSALLSYLAREHSSQA